MDNLLLKRFLTDAEKFLEESQLGTKTTMHQNASEYTMKSKYFQNFQLQSDSSVQFEEIKVQQLSNLLATVAEENTLIIKDIMNINKNCTNGKELYEMFSLSKHGLEALIELVRNIICKMEFEIGEIFHTDEPCTGQEDDLLDIFERESLRLDNSEDLDAPTANKDPTGDFAESIFKAETVKPGSDENVSRAVTDKSGLSSEVCCWDDLLGPRSSTSDLTGSIKTGKSSKICDWNEISAYQNITNTKDAIDQKAVSKSSVFSSNCTLPNTPLGSDDEKLMNLNASSSSSTGSIGDMLNLNSERKRPHSYSSNESPKRKKWLKRMRIRSPTGIKSPLRVVISFRERYICDKYGTSGMSYSELLRIFSNKKVRKKKNILSDSSSGSSLSPLILSENSDAENVPDFHCSSNASPVYALNKDSMDMDILQQIGADSSSAPISDSDESKPESNKIPRRKKFRKRSTGSNPTAAPKPGSEWKRDSLLRGTLPGESPKRRVPYEDDNVEENGVEQLAAVIKEEPIYPEFITYIGDETDSDIEFVSYSKQKKKKQTRKKRNSSSVLSDSDDDDDVVAVDETPADPKTGGRRNIRSILSEEDLNKETQIASLRERERVERLEEIHKQMSQVLSQEELSGNEFFLDATPGCQIKVHPVFVDRMKEHQKDGVRFMWDACYESVESLRAREGSGCILAHCMGLGKTYQVVVLVHTLFAHEATNTKHVLIVCPLSTVVNWRNEFFVALRSVGNTPRINIFTLSDEHRDKSEKIAITRRWRSQAGVLIMGYECFISLVKESKDGNPAPCIDALISPGPDLIVCDEGHLLKNDVTQRTKALMRIRTKRRIILTGTPMQNNLNEYYHMVQFVKPNLLGMKKEFKNRFVSPIENGQYGDSTEHDILLMRKRSHVLHSILKNTVQRVEEKVLEQYLPEKLDYVIMLQLSPIQETLYRKAIEFLEPAANRVRLFNDYYILQTIWTHPFMLKLRETVDQRKHREKQHGNDLEPLPPEDDDTSLRLPIGWWKDIVPDDFEVNLDYGHKFKVLFSLIKECDSMNDKLLVFTSSLVEMDAIEHFLSIKDQRWVSGVTYLRMDGQVSATHRQSYCDKFNSEDNNIKLFIISHKVGGLGLNLFAANRVLLMDVCFNPSYDQQSIFRIYRLGQVKPCFVYRFVAKGTMEEVIYERAVTKQAVAGRVVDKMQIDRHYKFLDLSSMYRCKIDLKADRPFLKLPSDTILAELLQAHKVEIFSYHEQENLLANRPEEVLNVEEMQLAWDEFQMERNQQQNQLQNQQQNQLQNQQRNQPQFKQLHQLQNQHQGPPSVRPKGFPDFVPNIAVYKPRRYVHPMQTNMFRQPGPQNLIANNMWSSRLPLNVSQRLAKPQQDTAKLLLLNLNVDNQSTPKTSTPANESCANLVAGADKLDNSTKEADVVSSHKVIVSGTHGPISVPVPQAVVTHALQKENVPAEMSDDVIEID